MHSRRSFTCLILFWTSLISKLWNAADAMPKTNWSPATHVIITGSYFSSFALITMFIPGSTWKQHLSGENCSTKTARTECKPCDKHRHHLSLHHQASWQMLSKYHPSLIFLFHSPNSTNQRKKKCSSIWHKSIKVWYMNMYMQFQNYRHFFGFLPLLFILHFFFLSQHAIFCFPLSLFPRFLCLHFYNNDLYSLRHCYRWGVSDPRHSECKAQTHTEMQKHTCTMLTERPFCSPEHGSLC